MSDEVVRLGALCELRAGTSAAATDIDFDVSEWLELRDGRRVVLHRDRGFGGRVVAYGVVGPPPEIDQWDFLTLDGLREDVLTTVLPDDAEATREAHPWEWLADLAREQGVAVAASDLRLLPYVVEFSPQLLERLRPPL